MSEDNVKKQQPEDSHKSTNQKNKKGSKQAKPNSHHPKGDKKKRSNKRSGKNSNYRRKNTGYSGPRRVSGGIRLRSSSGKSARNWWAQRWIRSMENVVDPNRLRRGRYYASQGQVLSIDEGDAEMVAKVQGSRPKPYIVRISLVPFTDEEWDKLLFVLAKKAIFAAELLSGQMPNNIETVFAEAGVGLFPNHKGDILNVCTCPDSATGRICKHVAATHYILGDRFDDDPFLLFRLRGRTQEEIIEGLRVHRQGEHGEIKAPSIDLSPQSSEVAEHELPLEQQTFTIDNQTMGQFWQNDDDLNDFPIHIVPSEIQFPIFRRLGEPDAAGQHSMEELLGNAYLATAQAAQIIAFMGGDITEEEVD